MRAIEWAKGYERGRKNGIEDGLLSRGLQYSVADLDDEDAFTQGYVTGYNRGVTEGQLEAVTVLVD